MRFKDIIDDEWVQPIKNGHKLACCDCGLVHTMNYRIVKGRVQFQALRDEKLTRSLRRRKQYKNVKL